jgi:predicted nucleotidyltransferase
VAEALDRDAVLEELRRRLSDLPSYVKAVLLFGSLARGEASERSDIDLLLLHDDTSHRDPVELRWHLYELVTERLASSFESITVVDAKLEEFLRPKIVTPPVERVRRRDSRC